MTVQPFQILVVGYAQTKVLWNSCSIWFDLNKKGRECSCWNTDRCMYTSLGGVAGKFDAYWNSVELKNAGM